MSRLRNFAAGVRRTFPGSDLALWAAGATYFGVIGLVPLALASLWCTRLMRATMNGARLPWRRRQIHCMCSVLRSRFMPLSSRQACSPRYLCAQRRVRNWSVQLSSAMDAVHLCNRLRAVVSAGAVRARGRLNKAVAEFGRVLPAKSKTIPPRRFCSSAHSWFFLCRS